MSDDSVAEGMQIAVAELSIRFPGSIGHLAHPITPTVPTRDQGLPGPFMILVIFRVCGHWALVAVPREPFGDADPNYPAGARALLTPFTTLYTL